MRTNVTMLWLLVVGLGLIVAACGGGGDDPPPAAEPVVLSGAPQNAALTQGEALVLLLTLQNDSGATTALSDRTATVLRGVSLTRDGTAVAPVVRARDSEEDTQAAMQASLQDVPDGAQLPLQIQSVVRSAVTGQALTLLVPQTDGTDEASIYDVGTAGAYALTLHYEYDGPVPAGRTVHTAATNAITLNWTVAP